MIYLCIYFILIYLNGVDVIKPFFLPLKDNGFNDIISMKGQSACCSKIKLQNYH